MDAAPFYRKAWFGTLGGAVLFGIGYAWASGSSRLPQPALTFLLDAFLFCTILLLMIAVASQFFLPARSLDERRQAFGRTISFLLGQHGPISIVENGRLAPVRGKDRAGAGVLFVDPASAAVLRTPTRFTRAVGPGLSFTAPGERVAEAIDVRRQVRSFEGQRPTPGDVAGPGSAMALTGDGVPIAADLSVTFMLDPGHTLPPREGRSAQLPPYEVNLQAAERAAYGHAYGDGAHEDLPWAELPLRLAIDLFREEIKRHRLDELLDDRSTDPSPVRRLQDALQVRMVPTPGVPSERGAAQPPTKEQQVLAARGIRVLSVSLGNLLLPERVQEGRMQRWRESLGTRAGSKSAGFARPEATSPLDPDAAWADLTHPLEVALAKDVAPGLQSTLQLILSEAVRLADQIDEAALRQRVMTDVQSMASALGASPPESAGSGGEGKGR